MATATTVPSEIEPVEVAALISDAVMLAGGLPVPRCPEQRRSRYAHPLTISDVDVALVAGYETLAG